MNKRFDIISPILFGLILGFGFELPSFEIALLVIGIILIQFIYAGLRFWINQAGHGAVRNTYSTVMTDNLLFSEQSVVSSAIKEQRATTLFERMARLSAQATRSSEDSGEQASPPSSDGKNLRSA